MDDPAGALPVECVITDDELVALAQQFGIEWTRPLDTVDLEDRDDTVRAVARGVRSLMIRGLVDAGGRLHADTEIVRDALRADLRLTTTWVDDEMGQLPGVERFDLLQAPGDTWIARTSFPGGVHRLVRADAKDGLGFFGAIATTHLATSSPQTLAVVGYRPGDACVRGLTFGSATASEFVVEPGKALATRPRPDVTSETSVRALLELITGRLEDR